MRESRYFWLIISLLCLPLMWLLRLGVLPPAPAEPPRREVAQAPAEMVVPGMPSQPSAKSLNRDAEAEDVRSSPVVGLANAAAKFDKPSISPEVQMLGDRYSTGEIIEQRGHIDEQKPGLYRRSRLIRWPQFKYPLIRVDDEVEVSKPDDAVVKRQVAEVADHVIIKPRPDLTEAQVLQGLADMGAKLDRKMPASGIWIVSFPKANLDTVSKALAKFREAGTAFYSERDYVVHADIVPNDSSFSSLWGMHNTGAAGGVADADIDAPEAWEIATGSRSVLVGIIDTGLDYTHPDIAANAWTNPNEIAGNGVDDDGNGYIDDTRGWDFANNDRDPMDDNRHGTHCAGTIGAVGNNSSGVAGVNWQVSLVGLKFLAADGSGASSDAVEAVAYANGIHVQLTSNSWGGGGFLQAMQDQINAASTAGILFVAAAGNSSLNTDASANYPSGYTSPNVISVGASTRTDTLASFSNYGATTVDLMAPGSEITSTVPGGGYASLSGTSMATPHVAGACALLKSFKPSMPGIEIKDALLEATDKVAAYAGKCVSGGRLNLSAMLLFASDLTTSPGVGIIASAPLGGPVPVTSQTYTLTNRGDTPAHWQASVDQPWVQLSTAAGVLASGASTTLTVSIDSALAAQLPVGLNAATLMLTNSNTGRLQTRAITLDMVPPPVYSNDLNSDPGWPRDGQWAYGRPTGGGAVSYGQRDPASGATGSNVFGVNLSGDYTTSVGGPYVVTAGPYDLSNYRGTRVQYQRWLNSDYEPWTSAFVQVSTNGTTWTDVWRNGGTFLTASSWTKSEHDLSAFADKRPQVWVRWGYQINLSSGVWACSGWNVDDIRILGALDRSLTLTPAPVAVTEGDSPVSLTLSIHPVPTSESIVELVSSSPTQIAVPATITIASGQTTASVPVTIIDDALGDGSQSADITATVSGYPTAKARVIAHDNESRAFSLTAPAMVSEGAGAAAGQSMLTLAAPAEADISITLVSSLPGRVSVPSLVTIPTGQTSVAVPLSIVDDLIINGTQAVTLTASMQNWPSATAGTSVEDNEARTLTLQLPPRVREDLNDLSKRGTILLAGTLLAPLSVQLISSDNTELIVPATVVINAGSDRATFALTPVDDILVDGLQRISVTASAASFISGSATLDVFDNETPATPANALPADKQARTDPTADLTWGNLPDSGENPDSYDVYFGTSATLGAAQRVAAGFKDGTMSLGSSHTWALPRLKRGVTYYWRIVARRGAVGVSGPIWSFTVPSTGKPASYHFITLSKSYPINTPFRVAITAFDEFGNVATEDGGPVTLSSPHGGTASLGEYAPEIITLTNGIWDGKVRARVPHSPTNIVARNASGATGGSGWFDVVEKDKPYLQALKPSLIEGSGLVANALRFRVNAGLPKAQVINLECTEPGYITSSTVVLPASALEVLAPMNVLDNSRREGPRPMQIEAWAPGLASSFDSIVIQDNEDNPLTLILPETVTEGVGVLAGQGMISMAQQASRDITVAISIVAGSGVVVPTSVVIPQGQTSKAFDIDVPQNSVLDGTRVVAITATVSGWAPGSATMSVQDDEARTISVTLPASGAEGIDPGVHKGTLTLAGSAATNIVMLLESSDTRQLTLPASVTLAAGATFVQFPITYVNDTVMDGTATVTITATAVGLTLGSKIMNVFDDDVHHFTLSALPAFTKVGVPLPLTVTARDVSDTIMPFFGGPASITASGGAAISPAILASFSGGTWTGTLRFLDSGTGLVLTVSSPTGSGTSTAIDVTRGAAIRVTPNAVSARVPQGTVKSRSVYLHNDGLDPLNWSISTPVVSGHHSHESARASVSLELDLTALNNRSSEITALIPGRYDFSDGVTGTNIADGGNDMYDGGNFLTANASAALAYSDNAVISTASLGAGSRYFTRKYPGLFVFAADYVSGGSFQIDGDLGADGNGSTDTAVLTSTRGAITYKGFVKRVYDAGDPSVNHLVIMAANGTQNHSATPGTASDYHAITGLSPNTRIYYLLYAHSNGGYIDNTATTAIMERFLDIISSAGTGFLSAAPTSGVLAPGQGTDVSIKLDAIGYPTGDYSGTVNVTSDDVLNPSVPVSATMTVVPGVHHFTWDNVPSPQFVNQPFNVRITARDAASNLVTDFAGTVTIGDQAEVFVGNKNSTFTSAVPFMSYSDSRTQIICTLGEVGYRRLDGLSLDIATGSPSTFKNLTIRLKTTSQAQFVDGSQFDPAGWTTVFRGDVTVPAPGWKTFMFTRPFYSDGSGHVLVDISINNSGPVTAAYCSSDLSATSRVLVRDFFDATNASDPLTWNMTGAVNSVRPNLKFHTTPLAIASFTGGEWAGPITLSKASPSYTLLATDPATAMFAWSNTIVVSTSGTLSLNLAPNLTEGSGTLPSGGTVGIGSVQTTDTVVALNCSLPGSLSVPDTVIIPAGQVSAAFALTLPDDAVFESSAIAELTATSSGFETLFQAFTVADNETTSLALDLPDVIEGAFANGILTLGSVAATPVAVALSSSSQRLLVPSIVVIPAGQTSVSFGFTALPNTHFDGNASVTVTATCPGTAGATRSITVTDDESRLTLSNLPTSVSEAGAPVSACRISLGGSATSAVTVKIDSSDTTELASITVIIPAGASTATFSLTPINDSLLDGTQVVTLTASAPGLTLANSQVSVLDDEIHHFAITTIPSPQVRNKTFQITVTGVDAAGIVVGGYGNAPNLQVLEGGIPINATLARRTDIDARTWDITIKNFSNGVFIRAQDVAQGVVTDSNTFVVGTGPATIIDWGAVSAHQRPGVPFGITLTAKDAGGNVATDFAGPVNFSVPSSGGPTVTIGSGSSSWASPFWGFDPTTRLQCIYPAAAIGGSRTITSIALDVTSNVASSFEAFTIRLGHTSQSSFASYDFVSAMSTVYSANLTGAFTPGWRTFELSTPFDYNGTDNLVLETSFQNPAVPTVIYVKGSNGTSNTYLWRTGGSTENPLSWTSAAYMSSGLPNIRLGSPQAGSSIVSPAQSGAFNNGVWSGNVIVTEPAKGLRIIAAGGGANGTSPVFDAIDRTLAITVSGGQHVEGSSTTGTITLSTALTAPLDISLSTSDTSVAIASPAITIPVGGTTATFSLIFPDDVDQDGTEMTTLTASAPGSVPATLSLSVRDNDLHHLVLSTAPGAQVKSQVFSGNVIPLTIDDVLLTNYAAANLSFTAQNGDGSALPLVATPGSFTVSGYAYSFVINAFASGAVITVRHANGSIVAQSEPFDVTPGPMTALEWSAIPVHQSPGVPFEVTLTARDAAGNTATGFTGNVTFQITQGGIVTPSTSGAFINGTWTGAVATNATGLARRITATSGIISSNSPALDVLNRTLTLSLPSATLVEGGIATGTLRLNTALSAPLTVSLRSSDSTRAAISPPTATFAAGVTSVPITVQSPEDDLVNGTAIITLTATSASATSSSQSLTIYDNDAHHLGVAIPSGAQVKGREFTVAVTGLDAGDAPVPGYARPVTLTASDGTQTIPLTSEFLGVSNNSLQYNVTINTFATGVTLTASDVPLGITGQSAAFDVGVGLMASLEWTSIFPRQRPGVAFPVSLRARDAEGNVATGFAGPVRFVASTGGDKIIGTGTIDWLAPFYGNRSVARLESIYKASLIGGGRLITAIAYNVKWSGMANFTAFTIRLKHTTDSNYGTKTAFDNEGWTTVFSGPVSGFAGGWKTISFSKPFLYDGIRHLKVETSFANPPTAYVAVSGTQRGERVALWADSGSDANPLLWTASLSQSTDQPNIRLTSLPAPAPTPASSGSFVDGVWSGNLTLPAAQANVTLVASASEVFAHSPLITIAQPAYSISVPIGIVESGAAVPASITASFNVGTPAQFRIAASAAAQLSLPATVVLPAAATSVPFDIAGIDNAVAEEDINITITAFEGKATTAPAAQKALLKLFDDDPHHFAFSVVPATQVAGAPFNITLSALSPTNKLVTGFTGVLDLDLLIGTTSLGITPSSTARFADGKWTGDVTPQSVSAAAYLRATGYGLTAKSNTFKIMAPIASSSARNAKRNTAGALASSTAVPAKPGSMSQPNVSDLLAEIVNVPHRISSARPMVMNELASEGVTRPASAEAPSIEMQYRRRLHRSGLVYLVETSADLVHWSATEGDVVEISAVPASDGVTEIVTVRINAGASAHPVKFSRVRVDIAN